LVLCTHRQSLANIATRIVVMEKGQKVLDGPRADVAAQLQQIAAAKAAE
jgi:ATP-binding cassette subfamily C protein LapB